MAKPTSSLEPPRSGFGILWGSLKRANTVAGGILAIGLAVVLWRVAPTTQIGLWWVVPMLLVTGLLAWVFADAFYEAMRLVKQAPTAEIVAVQGPDAPFRHTKCAILVKWSGAAVQAVGSKVQVSILEGEYERALGDGTVRKQQANGHFLVTLDACYDEVAEARLKKILVPDSALAAKIVIGPAMSFQQVAPTPVTPTERESAAQAVPGPPPTTPDKGET